jgi:hypothetical protein
MIDSVKYEKFTIGYTGISNFTRRHRWFLSQLSNGTSWFMF